MNEKDGTLNVDVDVYCSRLRSLRRSLWVRVGIDVKDFEMRLSSSCCASDKICEEGKLESEDSEIRYPSAV